MLPPRPKGRGLRKPKTMTRSVEEQMADIERRMKQLRARKQRIVARENAKARKRRTHLIIRLGGILSNEGVLGYDDQPGFQQPQQWQQQPWN